MPLTKLELSKYNKFAAIGVLSFGFFCVFTETTSSFFWFRTVIGIVALVVGSIGLKGAFQMKREDAKWYFYTLLFLVFFSTFTSMMLLIMRNAITSKYCGADDLTEDENCNEFRDALTSITIFTLILTDFFGIPFLWLAKRFWQSLESESGIGPELVLNHSDL